MLLCLLFATLTFGQEIRFDVMEETPPAFLGNIPLKANLTHVLGQQELSTLQYTVVEANAGPDAIFIVDQATGDLSTRMTLDREALCGSAAVCTVRCDVALQSSSPESNFFRKYSVVVYILDVNDNAPMFSQQSFVAVFSEQAAENTPFLLPTAIDADAQRLYKIQRYALEPKLAEFDLSVIQEQSPSGEVEYIVSLKVVKALDRETKKIYSTSLVAYDGGTPPRRGTLPITVDILDENDNGPVFEKALYRKTLSEESRVGAVALKVRARDLDEGENARVTYSMSESVESNVRELFTVERSGFIKIRSSLDMRGGNTYSFDVVAKDNGVPQRASDTRVLIDILDTRNDRPEIEINPLFSRFGAAVVPESAAIGKVVALLTVTDRDSGRNGMVTCELDNTRFSLQKLQQNEFKVIVAQPLDREQAANHTVVIFCRDGGDPSLSTERLLWVEVSDSNDNLPVFSSTTYFMTVDENEVIGMKVGRVTATDKDFGENARLTYGMENNGDTFTIDSMLGDIYTTRFLDREAKPIYVFNVNAYDNGKPPHTAMATVTVNVGDKNDLRPVFTNKTYKFQIQERIPVGRVIGYVKATDGDLGLNAKVEYFIVEPKSIMPVGVNASGAVVVMGDVNYERASVYNFVVAAMDLGSPPQNTTAQVIVEVMDKNDYDPVISFPSVEHPSVTISFDTPPGSKIYNVVAYDFDSGRNGQLSYSINVVNGSSLFVIDESTGVISLGDQVLPYDVTFYNVVVSVSDNGSPQRAKNALLEVYVSWLEEEEHAHINMKIAIALICVTLALAIIVLITVLIIRCIDSRRRGTSEKHQHEVMTKAAESHLDGPEKEMGYRTATVFTSKREQTALYSPKRQQSCTLPDDSVIFESEPSPYYMKEKEASETMRRASKDSLADEKDSVGNFSTFKPPPRPCSCVEDQVCVVVL
nr:hypothetical protein BaRGS_002089 [Batillaria attramentaria]